jgi:hypothetical protein
VRSAGRAPDAASCGPRATQVPRPLTSALLIPTAPGSRSRWRHLDRPDRRRRASALPRLPSPLSARRSTAAIPAESPKQGRAGSARAAPRFANLATRRSRRPSSRCVDQRGALLWHELGCASAADGAARRRLPIASFVPASKRTALVLSSGSEHLADWPRGFRSGRNGGALAACTSAGARRLVFVHSTTLKSDRDCARVLTEASAALCSLRCASADNELIIHGRGRAPPPPREGGASCLPRCRRR